MKRILCVLIFMAMIAGVVFAIPRLGGVRQGADIPLGDAETVDGIEGATIITNIEAVVLSNAFEIIRIANNRYIVHVQTNDSMTGQSVQDIFVKVDLGGAALALADSATTAITFSNEVEDVGGNWDSTTHQFDVPINGVYTIGVQGFFTGTLTDGNTYAINIRTNNSVVIADGTFGVSGTGNHVKYTAVEIRLTTNHFVDFSAFSGGTSDSLDGGAGSTIATIRLVRED